MNEDGPAFSVEAFLAELEAIPWFGRLGQPLDADAGVIRLRGWEEWPGPHEPAVDELFRRQQLLYDALLAEAGDARPQLLAFWDCIHQAVLRAAAAQVPYDPEQDCYHAPTTAVWSAIWTAGLVGWCRYTRRAIPDDLAEQWRWFHDGFWPSGYASVDSDGKTGPLLLF